MISFKSNHLDDVINLVIFIETHCLVPPLLLLQGSVTEENMDLGRSSNMDNVWCSYQINNQNKNKNKNKKKMAVKNNADLDQIWSPKINDPDRPTWKLHGRRRKKGSNYLIKKDCNCHWYFWFVDFNMASSTPVFC